MTVLTLFSSLEKCSATGRLAGGKNEKINYQPKNEKFVQESKNIIL